MNAAWKTIFDPHSNAATPPPNSAFLDTAVSNLENEANASDDISIEPHHVQEAIRQLRNRKASGLDNTANEALKLIQDEEIVQALATLFTSLANNPASIDPSWKSGLICLVAKKKAIPGPEDYRPIALLSHLSKLFELSVKTLLEWEYAAESLIPGYQGGFRKGRGTPECSLVIKAIDQLCRREDLTCIATFLDIKKAFDSVDHRVIAASLMRLELPRKLCRLLYQWTTGHKRRLIVPGNEADDEAWLDVRAGTPQGAVLSPFIFAAVMDTLHKYLHGEAVLGMEARQPHPVRHPGLSDFRILMYADDSTVFHTNIADLKQTLQRLDEWSKFSSNTFHSEKFQCLTLGRAGYNEKIPNSPSHLFAPKTHDQGANMLALSRHAKYRRTGKIQITTTATHLGLNVHSAAKRPDNEVLTHGKSFLSTRIQNAHASIRATSFLYRPKPTGATAKFASLISRSVAEGVYFGSDVCSIPPRDLADIRSLVGKAAKASLGVGGRHGRAGTTSALSFLGWDEPKVVIASRRLLLLKRALTSPHTPVAHMNLFWDALIALGHPDDWSNDENGRGPSEHLNLITSSLRDLADSDLIDESIISTHWPTSKAEWAALRLDTPALVDKITSLIDGMTHNHQHPLLREAPHLAATAYRFTCPSLRPYITDHSPTTPHPRCRLCDSDEPHSDSGFHLLTACTHPQICAIREGILPSLLTTEWRDAVLHDGHFAALNKFIDENNPDIATGWTAEEDGRHTATRTKTRDYLLINGSGNHIDNLARLLQHHFRNRPSDTPNPIYFREGTFSLSRSAQDAMSDGAYHHLRLKDRVLSAYRWSARLCAKMWAVYCQRPPPPSPRTPTDTTQP